MRGPEPLRRRAELGLLVLTGCACLSSQPMDAKVAYEKITYGTCGTHTDAAIPTLGECSAAAVALGTPGSGAKARPLATGNGPPGCYDNGMLWFNSQASSRVKASPEQAVLCKKTGSSEPVVSCTFCGKLGGSSFFMHLALPNRTYNLTTTASAASAAAVGPSTAQVLAASPCSAAAVPAGVCSPDVATGRNAAVFVAQPGVSVPSSSISGSSGRVAMCYGLGHLSSNSSVTFVPYEHGWGANITVNPSPSEAAAAAAAGSSSCGVVYHMVCNRSAPVSSAPEPIVRESAGAAGMRGEAAAACTYHITWQHPSVCADLVDSPPCTKPVPYPPEKYACDSSMCTVAVAGGTMSKSECQSSCVADGYKCVNGKCEKAAAGVPKVTCEAACG